MSRATAAVVAALVLVLTTAQLALAQALPMAAPEQVGLSSARLARIGDLVRADVEKGRLPGAVVLVARRGKVAYFESIGFRDKAAGARLERDAIFRIYSMTKPFTSVATMMLYEEGKLLLTDPVSRHLPPLGKVSVGVEKKDPATGQVTLELEPARREMTIQDLLRHTSGLTYGVFGTGLVKKMYLDAGADGNNHTNAELIDKLAKLPLVYQPGTTWEYSRSTDVLGRVVEVLSGQTLGQVLGARIYQPLGMRDTSFFVPADKHGRIAEPLATDPDSGKPVTLRDVKAPPKYESGGGGAVGTAADYFRFAQMLLNRGQLDGARLLSRHTVEYMTADHLGPITGPGFAPGTGYGFGLGFAVRRDAGVAGYPGSIGDYHWSGLGGTTFWVDPKEELVAIWMMQAPNQRTHYRQVFRTLVYQALE